MFNPSRDEARRFFFDTWGKYRRGEALSGLERPALAVISLHPEYHALLDASERHLERDFRPEDGGINPFLHLSLHLAVEEQLAIDQPAGILALYQRLLRKAGSEHDAKHALLECLGEMLWQAQRLNAAPDPKTYLACLEKRAGPS